MTNTSFEEVAKLLGEDGVPSALNSGTVSAEDREPPPLPLLSPTCKNHVFPIKVLPVIVVLLIH